MLLQLRRKERSARRNCSLKYILLKTEMEGKTCDFQDVLSSEPEQEEQNEEEKEVGQPKLQSRVR